MFQHPTVFLYAKDVLASTRFYRALLQTDPVQASPGFALFVLPSGLPLALWKSSDIAPPPTASTGGSEIGFKLDRLEKVDAVYADWKAMEMTIALPPTDADFGRSLLATDPDGHRLRVYAMR